MITTLTAVYTVFDLAWAIFAGFVAGLTVALIVAR